MAFLNNPLQGHQHVQHELPMHKPQELHVHPGLHEQGRRAPRMGTRETGNS